VISMYKCEGEGINVHLEGRGGGGKQKGSICL